MPEAVRPTPPPLAGKDTKSAGAGLRRLPMAGGARDAVRARPGSHVLISLTFVATGISALLVGAVLLAVWAGDVAPAGGWGAPHTFALVHVVALNFVTAIAIGVLYHVAPLGFGRQLAMPAAGFAVWAGLVGGASVMTSGLATARSGWVAAGGGVLGVTMVGFAAHIGSVALKARRRDPPTLYQAVAVAGLASVGVLGATIAVMLDRGAPDNLLNILAAKIVLAIGGWLGLVVVGVSYQLVPMFTLTPTRPRTVVPALVLLSLGIVGAVAACLRGAPAPVRVVAACPYAAGAALHAADIVRLVAARRERALGPVAAGQVLGATLFALGAAIGVVAMTGQEPWPQLAVATALVGWTPVLITANAARIVPFIVWQGLPAGRRPRTWAPARASVAWLGLVSAITAWAALTTGLVTHSTLAVRVAGGALALCACALLVVATETLRRARWQRFDAP